MKIFSFDYNRRYSPSAPFVEIEVGNYDGDDFPITIIAQVDSGADATMLPILVLESVGARFEETRYVRDFMEGSHIVDVYSVALRLVEQTFYLRVVAQENTDEGIVGRDILNHLVVTLNGPASVTELLIDPT
ncbi:MAG: hypothetical protein GY796_18645 [Chloroflexi bacterium]|nr:hypothetical protein [Chloroflexota bacterium]